MEASWLFGATRRLATLLGTVEQVVRAVIMVVVVNVVVVAVVVVAVVVEDVDRMGLTLSLSGSSVRSITPAGGVIAQDDMLAGGLIVGDAVKPDQVGPAQGMASPPDSDVGVAASCVPDISSLSALWWVRLE